MLTKCIYMCVYMYLFSVMDFNDPQFKLNANNNLLQYQLPILLAFMFKLLG